MGVIWTPRKSPLHKPQGFVELDYTNPLTDKLIFFWGMHPGSGSMFDPVTGTLYPLPSGVTWAADNLRFNGGAWAFFTDTSRAMTRLFAASETESTYVVKARAASLSTDQRLLGTFDASGTLRGSFIWMDRDGGGASWAAGHREVDTGNVGEGGTEGFDATRLQTVFAVAGEAGLGIYYGGYTDFKSGSAVNSASTAAPRLGSLKDLSPNFNGEVAYAALFSVCLDPNQRRSIDENPWQFFKPRTRTIFLPTTVSGIPVLSLPFASGITANGIIPNVTLTF